MGFPVVCGQWVRPPVARRFKNQVILVEDGCRGSRPDLHEAAVKIWAHKGLVRTTDQVISDYPWESWVDPKVRDPQMIRVQSGWWQA